MRPEQIEAWVLKILDQVTAGRRNEDTRVELKAQWPDPRKAARRIAAHANASGTDTVLWIVGLDEQRGVVVPVTPTDLANWLPQCEAEFDGLAPSLTDVVVPTPAGQLVGLLFDATRRPYVVRNPAYGIEPGDGVSLEVPWRSGTSARSARRDELLRLLVPLQNLPTVEVMSGDGWVERRPGEKQDGFHADVDHPLERLEHMAWVVRLTLYVTPRSSERVVFPFHLSSVKWRQGNDAELQAAKVRLSAPYFHMSTAVVHDSRTIVSTSGEALVDGPGKLELEARLWELPRDVSATSSLLVDFSLLPAGGDSRSVSGKAELRPGEKRPYLAYWQG
jgi:hypothetical protein